MFDYNEKTERFYVRSIYAPIVHAWVPKIYLCFDGEDPNQHGKRVRDAVVRRIEWENIMRFNLYVDCLPVDGLPSISEKVMDIILAKTLSTPRLEYTDKSLEKVTKIQNFISGCHLNTYVHIYLRSRKRLNWSISEHLQKPSSSK